jgi:hypothetical protein
MKKTPRFSWRHYISRYTTEGRMGWQLTINSSMASGLALLAGQIWWMLLLSLVAAGFTLALHKGRAGIVNLFSVGVLLGYYWEMLGVYFKIFSYPYTLALPPHTGPMWGCIAVLAACLYESLRGVRDENDRLYFKA